MYPSKITANLNVTKCFMKPAAAKTSTTAVILVPIPLYLILRRKKRVAAVALRLNLPHILPTVRVFLGEADNLRLWTIAYIFLYVRMQ